jgi:hypothetical protein
MCIVSDKLKFCTCVSSSTDKLNNYWLLHRFVKDKDLDILGLCIMPSEFSDSNFIMNSLTLQKRLNEPDAFDIPIKFKAKDQLEIVFNNLSKDFDKRLTYCFIFKKGQWVKTEHAAFELMNRYDEYAFGKLKNAKKTDKNG